MIKSPPPPLNSHVQIKVRSAFIPLELILLPLVTILLPHTMALYEPLGHLCLTGGSDLYRKLFL